MIKIDFAYEFHRIARTTIVRFGIVGLANTSIDFVLFYLFATVVTLPVFIANMLSTSVALGISFVLNKRAVFRDENVRSVRQFLVFIVGTLFGLWVLQGLVIVAITHADIFTSLFGANGSLVAAKIIATSVTMAWNYIVYSRYVFAKK